MLVLLAKSQAGVTPMVAMWSWGTETWWSASVCQCGLRGDQYVPAPARQIGGQGGGVFGVVEGEQPSRAGAQLSPQCLYRLCWGRASGCSAGPGGQLGKLVGDEG